MGWKLGVLLAVSGLLMAAAPRPTLGPTATGTMYNGNNAHPPQLPAPAAQPAVAPGTTNSGQGATGASGQGGEGAAHGGAG